MGRVTFFATAITIATFLASAPASAVETWGPRQNGSQCFIPHKGEGKDLQFGYWGACPQSASTAIKQKASNVATPRRPIRRAAQ